MLYLHVPLRPRIGNWLGILLGYWAILSFVAPPPVRQGPLQRREPLRLSRSDLSAWQDLGKYYGHGDNEGILSTLPAMATALLGLFAGEWLMSVRKPWTKVRG